MSADLQPMAVTPRPLGDYAPAAGGDSLERLRAAAEPLAGARVLHLSAAGGGGRVPELLGAELPLAASLGVEVEWRVLFGDAELQAGVRALHDGLQGAETALDDAGWDAYLEACAAAASGAGAGWDAVVLHDPGTLGLAAALEGTIAWRCHVDASQPDPAALERATPLAARAAITLAPAENFVSQDLRGGGLHAAPPGIDPLAPRNLELQPRLGGRLLKPLGVDLSRPVACHLMRMDRWKDPHGTIEAFELAKGEVPELQLALAGSLDAAETRDWRAAKEVSDYAEGIEDVLLLTSYGRVGDLELGALQRLARVDLHQAVNEGFGLGAAEALWKGTPVVGGVPALVRDGVDGYLASTPEQVAERIVELVRDPGLAVEMGRAGRERVRERYLVTHALERVLRALGGAVGAASVQPR